MRRIPRTFCSRRRGARPREVRNEALAAAARRLCDLRARAAVRWRGARAVEGDVSAILRSAVEDSYQGGVRGGAVLAAGVAPDVLQPAAGKWLCRGRHVRQGDGLRLAVEEDFVDRLQAGDRGIDEWKLGGDRVGGPGSSD